MSWSSLPEHLWKLILVHVPLAERLGSCSRVSKRLCRAAVAATEQLQLVCSTQRFQGVAQWLQFNGQYVTSLQVEGYGFHLTELRCQQLRQLIVGGGSVQLGPSSSHPGVLQCCDGLTKLELSSCTLVDGPDSLTALSAVPALQHLELMSNSYIDTDDQLHLASSILQALTQLTFLKLDDSVAVTAESLQHISALQHLQVLDLDTPSVALSPSSTPGLAQLTGLHTINLTEFHDHAMDAAVLQPFTGLRQLELTSGDLKGASSGAVLLSMIGRQLQLQKLALWEVVCQWPAAAAAYSALTISSNLQELTVLLDGLPAGVWQAVFRPGQQLLHLQKLVLRCWGPVDNESSLSPPVAISSTDISRLVACCPGLQHLMTYLQPDVQLTALSQLTALTSLSFSKASESSVKSLSGLSGLQDLHIHANTPLNPAALVSLTALKQLTRLAAGPVEGFDNQPCAQLVLNQQADDSAPDVWQQLLERYAASA